MKGTHSIITPAIMYWGTPVTLITTENEDGTANIGPVSSAWWLGHRCILGLASVSQTTINLLRTRQCVINLPSDDMAHYINPIAKTTGAPDVPPVKQMLGYEHCNDKFRLSGLTQQASDLVSPPTHRRVSSADGSGVDEQHGVDARSTGSKGNLASD